MPYGMLPVLEIDGKPIAQSNAVARYLAHEHNLAGKDEWESMLCDVLVDTLGDLKQCKWYICPVHGPQRLRKAAYLSPVPFYRANRYSFSVASPSRGRDFPFFRKDRHRQRRKFSNVVRCHRFDQKPPLKDAARTVATIHGVRASEPATSSRCRKWNGPPKSLPERWEGQGVRRWEGEGVRGEGSRGGGKGGRERSAQRGCDARHKSPGKVWGSGSV